MIDASFWPSRRVFITGHTGFKGSWLALWLHEMGADVTGFALDPPTTPSLFERARIGELIHDHRGDVRDLAATHGKMAAANPEIVFHLAAQSLVRTSYDDPIGTYATNVMGTAHVLEAARRARPRVVIVVTSDKCYENREWLWPYREDEPLGGHDPYSSSKACAEIVTAAFRSSFRDGPSIASVRAGNVIGGGDWAVDRLVPDCVRAFERGQCVKIRNPKATRPWQHVLEPLSGYVILAQRLFTEGERFAGAWNFGPGEDDVVPVATVVDRLANAWGIDHAWEREGQDGPHEAGSLKLDSSRARTLLGWRPRLRLSEALDWVVAWSREGDARSATVRQIDDYRRLVS
jgi:CDP-glucose 4,6-dehydratase